MLDKNARICPHCGERLVLTGAVMGDKLHERTGGFKSDTYAQRYRHVFEEDRLWRGGVDMFCGECGGKVALQENPRLVLGAALLLDLVLLAALIVITCVGAFGAIVPWLVGLAAAVTVNAALLTVYCCRLRYIKKWRSNFICADGEVVPDIAVSADIAEVPTKILHTANIFTFGMKGRGAALYLTDHTVDGEGGAQLCFHICSVKEDTDSIIAYLRENSGNITLDFEGHSVPRIEFIKAINKNA